MAVLPLTWLNSADDLTVDIRVGLNWFNADKSLD